MKKSANVLTPPLDARDMSKEEEEGRVWEDGQDEKPPEQFPLVKATTTPQKQPASTTRTGEDSNSSRSNKESMAESKDALEAVQAEIDAKKRDDIPDEKHQRRDLVVTVGGSPAKNLEDAKKSNKGTNDDSTNDGGDNSLPMPSLTRGENHSRSLGPGAFACGDPILEALEAQLPQVATEEEHSPRPSVDIESPPSSGNHHEGLVEATPVSEQSLPLALPHASGTENKSNDEEDDHSTGGIGNNLKSDRLNRHQSPPFWLLAGFALAVIGLVLVLIFGIGDRGNRNKPSNTNTTTAPIGSSSFSPTSAPTREDIQSLLPAFSLEALSSPTSPQRQAYDWLVEDPYLSERDSDSILVRFALATLYYATSGPDGWTETGGWLQYEVHECDWAVRRETFAGIREFDSELAQPEACVEWNAGGGDGGEEIEAFEREHLQASNDTASSRVYRNIWLDTNGLDGTVPDELFAITTLQIISILNNQNLKGRIPSELIGQMTDLKELSIATSQLSGTLPTEIGLLSGLSAIALAANSLTGTIPSEIGEIDALNLLVLDNNQLSGTLPTEVGQASNLSVLFIGNNDLSGTIPMQVGNLKALQALSIGQNNNMSGTIPTELVLAMPFFFLDLSGTMLSGVIPEGLCWTPQFFHDCGELLCGCSCNCTETTNSSHLTTDFVPWW